MSSVIFHYFYCSHTNIAGSVFPQPLGESTSVPDWAIAVITASVVTTFLWIFAVIILVRYY